MKIGRRDIIWAYTAQFFQIASGLLVLPLILRMLNTNEIAMYYLMLNISSLVVLFDFGFSGQFSRNFSYVFSGVKELKAEGIAVVPQDSEIDYHLLKTIIKTSQVVYRFISLVALIILLTGGTYYIYLATEKFTLVNNALLIWVLYSASVFFNMYNMYLNALLTGKGAIAESRKAIVYSKLVFIIMACGLLFLRFGLLGFVAANLAAPFVQRLLSLKYFYQDGIKKKLNEFKVHSKELKRYFLVIWYNAKKLGLVILGALAINKSGLFFAGLFLSADQVASYGLMIQLVGAIASIASTIFSIYQPKFANFRSKHDMKGLLNDFSLAMGFFYILFLLASAVLVFFGDYLLVFIKSNVFLPGFKMLVFFSIISLLEQNHSLFASMITTGNTVPFVIPSLVAGLFIIVGTYLVIKYTDFGLFGMILVPGVVQICYANWKWPLVVCKELNISFGKFFCSSFKEALYGINRFFKK
jgi:O-antigen/teichoic acid export membrane protein